MKSPVFAMTPDYSPVIKMMEMQTRFAVEASQAMMKLAMLPWQQSGAMQMPQMGFAFGTLGASTAPVAEAPAEKPVEKTAEPVADIVDAPVIEAAPEVAEPVAETTSAPVAEEVVAEPTPVVEAETVVDESGPVAPKAMTAPKGAADDLTALNGVGPKLAETLNEHGIYHYAQIAKWSDANVAWIDANVAGVRGRASRNAWVTQAADLAQ